MPRVQSMSHNVLYKRESKNLWIVEPPFNQKVYQTSWNIVRICQKIREMH